MKTTASLTRSKRITTFLTYAALILGSVIMIFPFVWRAWPSRPPFSQRS